MLQKAEAQGGNARRYSGRKFEVLGIDGLASLNKADDPQI
jgi:hypothetical protein